MSPIVEALPVPPLELGEGPHWNPSTQSLYLVDIAGKTVHRYHPGTDAVYTLNLDVPSVGFVTPVSGSDDKFLVGAGLNLRIVQWDGVSDKAESDEVLHILDKEPITNRINDGKSDSSGRAWFGTMKTEDILNGREGSFYSYAKSGGLKKHFTDIGISNGMAWNEERNRMYYIDSLAVSVDVVDYNTSGTIENRTVVFDFKKNNLSAFPDGMTIDSDGNLWVACYTGSRVIKVDPNAGKLLEEVKIPALNVTSVAWGGSDLADLYVTTAKAEGVPNSGRTYRVRGLSAKGLPMHKFKL